MFFNFSPTWSDYTYKISESCVLVKTSSHMVFVQCGDIKSKMESQVFKIGWNVKYIVFITHPLTKTDPNNPNNLNYLPDENITYWWIEYLENKKEYKFESEKEFNNKKKEFGIGNLELKEVTDLEQKEIY